MLQPKRPNSANSINGAEGQRDPRLFPGLGSFGIKTLRPAGCRPNRSGAAVALTRYMKREGQVVPDFPGQADHPRKPAAEVRMGKGKGNPEFWVAVVKPGTIIFEKPRVYRKQRHVKPCVWPPRSCR